MEKVIKNVPNLEAAATLHISGNGVAHVKASEIVKSRRGGIQITALKQIKAKSKKAKVTVR